MREPAPANGAVHGLDSEKRPFWGPSIPSTFLALRVPGEMDDVKALLEALTALDPSKPGGLKALQEKAQALLAAASSPPAPAAPGPGDATLLGTPSLGLLGGLGGSALPIGPASSSGHTGSPGVVHVASARPFALNLGVLVSEPLCSTRSGTPTPVEPVDWKTERALIEKCTWTAVVCALSCGWAALGGARGPAKGTPMPHASHPSATIVYHALVWE
jgi:hypothetical protein